MLSKAKVTRSKSSNNYLEEINSFEEGAQDILLIINQIQAIFWPIGTLRGGGIKV